MISIRKFLLINLLIAITITTSLTALGNYYLDKADIQEHLDNTLIETGYTLQAILTYKITNNNTQTIQNNLNQSLLNKIDLSDKKNKKNSTLGLNGKYQFQIFDNNNKLLLRSSKAPQQSLLSPTAGLSDKKIQHITWRVFTIHDPKTKLNYAVAEPYDARNHLAQLITEDDIYIMLLTYPLSGLLIWLIIGRALNSLKRVTNEVAYRAPTFLEPVDEQSVPLEIKPLVTELNNLFVRLKQAFEREQRFAADAAHELRTPLAAIRTQAQVALKATQDAERHTILNNVINGVDRSVHIVQQLLTLSRLAPETNTLEDVTSVNLVKLAADIVAQLAPVAINKQINIELEALMPAIEIFGNVTALSILVRNIVDNAIRYTPEGGAVKVSIHSLPNKVMLKVTDNGLGIPEELRERVFERFYRILGNSSPGSGLGLAIVQKIALLHHAEVKLEAGVNNAGLEISVIFIK